MTLGKIVCLASVGILELRFARLLYPHSNSYTRSECSVSDHSGIVINTKDSLGSDFVDKKIKEIEILEAENEMK